MFRNVKDLRGYAVRATDGVVLVAPQWIVDVRWSEATVSVDLTRQAVKDAPAYDSAAQLDRQQEQAMYEHYGRPGYGTRRAIRETAAPSAK